MAINATRHKWAISCLNRLYVFAIAKLQLEKEAAESLELAWDQVFEYLEELRDEVKPHVDEAQARAKE